MNRLAQLRESRGLKQKEVAKILNVNAGNYSRYEKGTLTPTTETLIEISKLYNVSIDYILGLDKSSGDVEQQLDNIIEYIKTLKKNL